MKQEHKDHVVRLANVVNLEVLGLMAELVKEVKLGLLGQQDYQVQVVQLDREVNQDREARQDLVENRALLALKDHKDQEVKLELLDPLDLQDHGVRVVHKDNKVHVVNLVQGGKLALLDKLDDLVNVDNLDLLGLLDHLDQEVKLEPEENLEHEEHLDHRDQQVFLYTYPILYYDIMRIMMI